MEKIVVIGGGGHAKSVIGIIKRLKKYELLGYVDHSDNGEILGVKYLGKDDMLTDIKKKHSNCQAVIGIGAVQVSEKRKTLIGKLRQMNFKLPVIVSPEAVINEDVSLGDGTVVHDGAVVNVGTTIGEGCIINTHASIDHDCTIADFAHIAPGATLSGGVVVEEGSIISVGANIIQYKKVARGCLVGAGATVVEDCLDPGVYLGTPARLCKK